MTDLTKAAAINEANASQLLTNGGTTAGIIHGINRISGVGVPHTVIAPPVTLSVAPPATLSIAPPAPTSAPVPTFMKQLQDTAEAAISAVEDWKRKANEVDGVKIASDIAAKSGARRKKNPTKEDCEIKLKRLRDENEMLKRHLDNVTNKTAKFEEDRRASEKKMKEMLNLCSEKGVCPTIQNELKKNLEQFSETYSDYGKRRQDELFFHLTQLEKLAAPTTFTKMSLWTLGQNETFFTEPNNNPIAGILRKELEITPTQGKKILSQRVKIQALCNNIKEVLQLIVDLKTLCQRKQKVFSDRMNKCQEILTPEQVTKLLVWIDNNEQVLASVCPGWGSERIRDAGKEKKGSH